MNTNKNVSVEFVKAITDKVENLIVAVSNSKDLFMNSKNKLQLYSLKSYIEASCV